MPPRLGECIPGTDFTTTKEESLLDEYHVHCYLFDHAVVLESDTMTAQVVT